MWVSSKRPTFYFTHGLFRSSSNPDSKENNLFVDTAHMYLENAVFLKTAYIAKGTESVDTYTMYVTKRTVFVLADYFIRQSMIYDRRLFELDHGAFHRCEPN